MVVCGDEGTHGGCSSLSAWTFSLHIPTTQVLDSDSASFIMIRGDRWLTEAPSSSTQAKRP